jgi:hypothetical protein
MLKAPIPMWQLLVGSCAFQGREKSEKMTMNETPNISRKVVGISPIDIVPLASAQALIKLLIFEEM